MDYYIDKQKTLDVIFEIAENVIKSLPTADELTIVTEYCRKRNLVIITMESFRVLQAYYNRQNGMDGERSE